MKECVIDYVDFAEQVEELPSFDVENVERVLQIERLYTGDLFGDKAYVWAIHEIERYGQVYNGFVIRQLMTIRELTDDKKGLTALYTDCVRLLNQELGIIADKKNR